MTVDARRGTPHAAGRNNDMVGTDRLATTVQFLAGGASTPILASILALQVTHHDIWDMDTNRADAGG
jgi:hypothetical protein